MDVKITPYPEDVGSVIHRDVKTMEIKWIEDFNWYGLVLHLAGGDTVTYHLDNNCIQYKTPYYPHWKLLN